MNKNVQKNFKQVNSLEIFASENKKSIRLDENEKTKNPGEVYKPLIKHRVRINDQKDVKGVYDTGANASSINQKIVDQIKADLTEHKSIFKTQWQ